jgi:hypothetical protein
VVSLAEGAWFLACEECFTDWPDPAAFKNHANAGFETYGRYRNAARAEVSAHPWREYVENRADLDS